MIESGIYAASIKERRVFVYEHKGAFGELALMYNCPRAATVQASCPGDVSWKCTAVTECRLHPATNWDRGPGDRDHPHTMRAHAHRPAWLRRCRYVARCDPSKLLHTQRSQRAPRLHLSSVHGLFVCLSADCLATR